MSSATYDARTANKAVLRPYQSAVIERAAELYRQGVRRLLVPLATGLGKTVIFTHLRQVGISKVLLCTDDIDWDSWHGTHAAEKRTLHVRSAFAVAMKHASRML